MLCSFCVIVLETLMNWGFIFEWLKTVVIRYVLRMVRSRQLSISWDDSFKDIVKRRSM